MDAKIIRRHWTEEDVRALIREELGSAAMQERIHRAVLGEVIRTDAANLTDDTAPPPRSFWRLLGFK